MATVIQNTETASDKYTTYRALTGRHKLAMKHGFFLEALLIDYAMLEDRLTSFLWYSGVTVDTNEMRFGNRYNKADLKSIFSAYTEQDDTIPRLRNISGKIETVRALIAFAKKTCDEQSKYCKLLYDALNTIDLDKLSEALDCVDRWRGYRNEVIHAAMKKNVFSLYEELETNAQLGMDYARVIDNAVKKLKNRPTIRRSVRMPAKKDG